MLFLEIILLLVAAYLGAGLLFAIGFLFWGIEKVDEGAAHASIGFRIIILPGLMVFWPVLLKKWLHEHRKTRTP
jgi:hypothetical protein